MPSAPIKAMILAASRGERMHPLTDSCPKPLIDWQTKALARSGFNDLVINTA